MPLKSNPHRLPRRNHYQEGPDFLFLATQGGRPRTIRSSPSAGSVVRRRRAALRRWDAGGSVADVCAEFACSRASLYRWRERFDARGLAGLVDNYRPGGRGELPTQVQQLVMTVRLLTYWNSRRLAAEFSRRGVWSLSHGQVDRLLARYATHRPSEAKVRGPRYERANPNSLWHIDLKGPFYLNARAEPRSCHFVALVDDFSRFLLGIRAVPTREAVPILEMLTDCVELCGVPLELMSDNGTPFVGIVQSILVRFQRSLAELGIRHIRTQIDTPWTNGKVEAFWDILQAEVLDRQRVQDLVTADAAVTAFATYYNYHRLHGELGWRTPAERFEGTPFTDRTFHEVPALAAVADLLASLSAA